MIIHNLRISIRIYNINSPNIEIKQNPFIITIEISNLIQRHLVEGHNTQRDDSVIGRLYQFKTRQGKLKRRAIGQQNASILLYWSKKQNPQEE